MPTRRESCIVTSSLQIFLLIVDGHAKIADFGIAKLNRTDVTLPEKY